MRSLLVAFLLVASTARADTREVDLLTLTAQTMAADGECEPIKGIGQRVRQLDPEYYRAVFAVDARISGCKPRAIVTRPAVELDLAPPLHVKSIALPVHDKSPATAIAISGLTTLGGVGLMALAGTARDPGTAGTLAIAGLAAFVIGPTLGHAYAGKIWNTGLAIRLGSVVAAAVGIGLAIDACPPFSACKQGSEAEGALGSVLAVTGVIGFGAGTLVEIATAGQSIHRRVTIVPAAGANPGLSLAGRF